MKKLLPVLIGLLGLAAGIGAGVLLKPAPAPATTAACGELDAAHGEATQGEAGTPCAPDPFSPAKPEAKKHADELAYVPMDKPFVVPVFAGEKVVAMVVVSLSVETDTESAHAIEAVKPRLRDGFLKVMFRHANSGGFDGSFTSGQKIEDLKSALLASAREVMPDTPVDEVLITEIARQDS